MKSFFLSIALLSMGTAWAGELAFVSNVRIEIVNGHPMAAVQPYAMVHFTVSSCGKREMSAQLSRENGVVQIQLIDSNPSDCRGMPRKREYSLQVSSDASGERYVILNPIAPIYRGNED